jgi:undecaprenyl-diphosphatase
VRERITSAVVAVVAFAVFFALGHAVTRAGEPFAFVGWEHALVNHGTLVAWWLTNACYPQVLIPIAVVLLIVAWRVPEWRSRILFSIVLLLLCWRGADFFQHIFARPRRLDWIVKHETSFSYPSSHAAIATGFYAFWGMTLALSELPRPARIAAGTCLPLLALAICWSRLALGAHYLTDLIGGIVLAVALFATTFAIVPIKILGSARPVE